MSNSACKFLRFENLVTYFFLIFIVFHTSLLSQEKKTATPIGPQPISIPDTEGITTIRESEKESSKDTEERIKEIAEEEAKGLERHRFFHVRYLPLAEGFANRPKELENERLLILGRVQARGIAGQTESNYNNGNRDFNSMDWHFRRVRLGFMYEGGTWWGMQMHIRLEDQINQPYITTTTDPVTGNVEQVRLNDSRGALQQANVWFNLPYMDGMVMLGMFRLPWLREWNTAANMMTPERTFAHTTIHQFDLGTQFIFHPLKEWKPKYKRHLLFRGSITNGAGAGHEGFGRRQALSDTRSGTRPFLASPAYHWRLIWNPFGGFIRDGYDVGWHEGEEVFQPNQRLSIGVGGAHVRELALNANYDALSSGVPGQNFTTVQNRPTGGTFDSNNMPNYMVDNTETTPSRRELGINAFTYDFTYTINGYYASGAYTRFGGGAGNDIENYNLTLGYVIPIKKIHIMPVYRYDVIEGDFDRNGRRDPTDILRNHWLGVNIFGDRHLMKFQLFYQIAQDKFGTNPYTNQYRDLDNNLVWFQVQMTFWSGTLKMDDKDGLVNPL
ncbi:MAG: hypothetical protein JJT78_02385 [Leptospira sp.]|nr:hypothetical protein [Leptospira sp.]